MFTQFVNRLRRAAGAVTRGTAALGLAGLLALGAVASNDAEAKRVGGSQSIGRQSQTVSPSGQTQRSQQAQPAQQATPPAAAATGNRWMGPLAGLAAGLGIAALLSSFGLGEGLAQMLSNALLIGLVVLAGVMLFRFIASRRRPDLAYGHGAANRQQNNGSSFFNQFGQARPDAMFRNGAAASTGATGVAGSMMPPGQALGTDQAAFLASAKTLFMRLQGAWDRNDQGDLFEMTTHEMFMRLKQDMEGPDGKPGVTDVTQLDAEVLGTERNADETMVSVRFFGQMREDDAQTAQPFEEVWNLVQNAQNDRAWRLAGIQQINR
ncbi:TIM44-like domain-containing protein [Paraburkholderia sp. C35]|uniref:Tim44 domain-containing protein n=1 Tax=Paraburkholderia sp. C35 TaxID=2126993 RepID=UPI000D69FDB4|nr:TIM44-like domain-containing protein [Paraburkholderia sp. C35]